jgi:hypothetical protein
MNFCSPLPHVKHGASLQPEWHQQLELWRDLIVQCAHKPSRKRVHLLRSLTLRLRTVLKFRLREQALEPAAVRAFNRWKKEGRKLRHLLEPVRDADVYLARLGSLHHVIAGSMGSKQQLNPRCLREIDKLQNRLKRQRQKRSVKMMAAIDARGKRLSRISLEMEAELASRIPSSPGLTAQESLRIFTLLAAELPALNSSKLHAWRKRFKQALYLAEVSASSGPAARQLAAALRKIHLAAGAWHDWQALALLAGRVLPGHGKQDGVVPVLNKLAEESLKNALSLCRQFTARLLKNAGEISSPLQRKPVASVPLPAQFTSATNLRVSSS